MADIQSQLARCAKQLARRNGAMLDRLKAEYTQLQRPDFLWHYLLQSFATMGRASGWHGLIGNKSNYNKLRFDVLVELRPAARQSQVEATCRAAKIRMPSIKAGYILRCFEQVQKLGGVEAARATLLAQTGREGKITFLKSFRGIGDKYARNIMMDVYHPDFRQSIAVDARIKALSEKLGLSFASYAAHEAFYLEVAAEAELNGWELDRLIFNFQDEFLAAAGD
ncbi:MAG: hypothetical protein HY301_00795 [Verrucomicrobia bacterium]|nr:hypothetical protein [Verrucomicrobiota bacterium]